MGKVLVLGAGLMGSGIAQVFANYGYEVHLYDAKPDFVEKGVSRIGKISEKDGNAEEVLSRVKPLYKLKIDGDIEVIIEAITENMEIKSALYKKLYDLVPDTAIVASNTSALSITELAAMLKKPENFVGMHFFSPAKTMKLVELIKGMQTSKETIEKAKELVRSIGKEGIELEEAPGFLVNRILVPFINEAVFALNEGVATAEDIDKALMLGANHPIGPLRLADMVGVDVALAVMETLHEKYGDSKYRPCPLLYKMVAAGYLGRKTKKGFFEY